LYYAEKWRRTVSEISVLHTGKRGHLVAVELKVIENRCDTTTPTPLTLP